MLFRILREDLKRKKTMNIIIFLFISIAALFLASSSTDMMIVLRGVDYYMEKAKVSDYVIFQSNTDDKSVEESLTKWLTECDLVKAYDKQDSILTESDSMVIEGDGATTGYKQSSASVLQVQPDKYCIVFDQDGNLASLHAGEIAIPLIDREKNDIEIGDQLTVTVGSITKKFTVACYTKDAVCGTSFMGMKRFLISKADYDELANQEGNIYQTWYMISTDQVDNFQKSLKAKNFNLAFSFPRATINLCYMTDMIVAANLLIVSVCLIMISFFALRFTIIFTIQEDYKDIGVMKAIGIRNAGIKSVYLVKYLAIAVFAALLGFVTSFPFAAMLVGQVSKNMLMEDTGQNPLINASCCLLVILLVVLFCYTSMKKLDKYSAIEAIRNGSSGERFKRKNILRLKKCRRMRTSAYIAINDILAAIRKYTVMILTFCLGTMLIIIPVNSMNTLKSGNMIQMFGMNKSDFYITGVFDSNIMYDGGKEKALDIMKQMGEKMEEAGIPAKLYTEICFTLSMHGEDKEDVYSIVTYQNLNGEVDDSNYVEGSKPLLENEIALSEVAAEHMKVGIGDTVYLMVQEEEKEFLITGIFQSMSNRGEGARINNIINLNYKDLMGVGYLQGDFIDENVNLKEARETLSDIFPDNEILSAKQYVKETMGSIVKEIDSFKNLVVILVLCIDGLITLLMIKTFVTKETSEIAMLKSIGFRNRALRNIQLIRIGIVQIISILLGSILSVLLDDYTVGFVFKFMGAKHIDLTVAPLEIYVIYPVLLFIVPILVAWIASFMVGKISIREMNGDE